MGFCSALHLVGGALGLSQLLPSWVVVERLLGQSVFPPGPGCIIQLRHGLGISGDFTYPPGKSLLPTLGSNDI